MHRDPRPPLERVQRGSHVDLLVLSRREAESVAPNAPHVVISITDPDRDAAELAESADRRAVLRLRFHDIAGALDLEPHGSEAGAEIAMSAAAAAEVAEFVAANVGDDVRLVVCHCEAGVSRSAAVAAAISKFYNGDDEAFFERYLPNSWVYRLVLHRLAAAADASSDFGRGT